MTSGLNNMELPFEGILAIVVVTLLSVLAISYVYDFIRWYRRKNDDC